MSTTLESGWFRFRLCHLNCKMNGGIQVVGIVCSFPDGLDVATG